MPSRDELLDILRSDKSPEEQAAAILAKNKAPTSPWWNSKARWESEMRKGKPTPKEEPGRRLRHMLRRLAPFLFVLAAIVLGWALIWVAQEYGSVPWNDQ